MLRHIWLLVLSCYWMTKVWGVNLQKKYGSSRQNLVCAWIWSYAYIVAFLAENNPSLFDITTHTFMLTFLYSHLLLFLSRNVIWYYFLTSFTQPLETCDSGNTSLLYWMLYFHCFWLYGLFLVIFISSPTLTCNLLFWNLIEESMFIRIPEAVGLPNKATVFTLTSKFSVNMSFATLCHFMHSYIAFDRR